MAYERPAHREAPPVDHGPSCRMQCRRADQPVIVIGFPVATRGSATRVTASAPSPPAWSPAACRVAARPRHGSAPATSTVPSTNRHVRGIGPVAHHQDCGRHLGQKTERYPSGPAGRAVAPRCGEQRPHSRGVAHHPADQFPRSGRQRGGARPAHGGRAPAAHPPRQARRAARRHGRHPGGHGLPRQRRRSECGARCARASGGPSTRCQLAGAHRRARLRRRIGRAPRTRRAQHPPPARAVCRRPPGGRRAVRASSGRSCSSVASCSRRVASSVLQTYATLGRLRIAAAHAARTA